jgi:IPT/TIG domain-containing protein
MRNVTQAGNISADMGRAMRRPILFISMLVLAATVLLPVAAADAKKRAKPRPTVTRVTPMRIVVGKKITIRGKHFSTSRRRNTVAFRSPRGRYAFAKPTKASSRKLVVKVPSSVERLLTKKGTKRLATRFKIRVVTKRYGKLTSRRHSPVVVSSLGSGDLVQCGTGPDWDGDLLTNSREAALKTDPCLRDTDADGVEDYFEVESALDINARAVPYPGKRPFPNALDASDANSDYDGDGLSMIEEYRAWAHPSANPAPSLLQNYTTDPKAPVFHGSYADHPRFGNHSATLNYSDGTQATVNASMGTAEYKSYLDKDNDLRLTDDERDADGDGLGNADELHSLMKIDYYPPANKTDPLKDYGANPAIPLTYMEPSYLNWDSDGDGVWDGNDDQDNDDVSNVDEIIPQWQYFPDIGGPFPIGNARDGSTNVLRTPYNPCKPYRSRTCNRYVPPGA